MSLCGWAFGIAALPRFPPTGSCPARPFWQPWDEGRLGRGLLMTSPPH